MLFSARLNSGGLKKARWPWPHRRSIISSPVCRLNVFCAQGGKRAIRTIAIIPHHIAISCFLFIIQISIPPFQRMPLGVSIYLFVLLVFCLSLPFAFDDTTHYTNQTDNQSNSPVNTHINQFIFPKRFALCLCSFIVCRWVKLKRG